MTVIWPTSWKHDQGKKRGTIAPLTIALEFEIDLTRQSSRSCVMYVYLLCTLSIQIAKTNLKLLVKMASEQERLTIVCYILNLLICKIFMRYSKTNTTWFISTSSKNYWSRGVGCVRLLPDAKRREVAWRIQHRLLPSIPCCICILFPLQPDYRDQLWPEGISKILSQQQYFQHA